MPHIKIIVAIDLNNAIGKDNDLLCYLPNDLKHFKTTTSGHTVIMGRKTFESLPNGALPNRRNIVLTKNADFEAKGVDSTNSLKGAIDLLENDETAFIIGGGSIYKESIDFVDEMWVTLIDHKFEGADTFFPKIDLNRWQEVTSLRHNADEKNKYAHNIILYKRIKS